MKSRKVILLVLSLLFVCESLFSQVSKVNKFVVITFELSKANHKNNQIFYWITPVDSIENKLSFNIFPLYTKEYSKDNFDRCMNGDSVDVFTNTTVTNYAFSESYKSQIDQFISLVLNKRTKLQTITLKWFNKDRRNEIINVYATPIIGEFCSCLQRHEMGGSHELEFRTLVYMPVSSFNLDDSFWNSENGRVVKYEDYSLIEFTSSLPAIDHHRSLCRAKSKVQIYE